MKAEEKIGQEIKDLLADYVEGYATKDVGRLLSHIAPDPDVTFIGSGPDEWVIGLDALRSGIERDLTQADEVRIDFSDVAVSARGDVAWLASRLVFRVVVGENKVILHGRFTAVLEKREGKWKFIQAHYSVPASDQARGQSYPID